MFNNQPTFGDNPTARGRRQPSKHQGDWWIGGYENRPSKEAQAGAIQYDRPMGRLTSPRFRIIGRKISFLIGGGCDVDLIRAELLVNVEVRSELIVSSLPCTFLRLHERLYCFFFIRILFFRPRLDIPIFLQILG